MTTSTSTTDRLRKQITLRATPARVWRALSTAQEFGAWFGATLRTDFAPGTTVEGSVAFQGKQLAITFQIERMEPERLLTFRWHPFAIDPAVDYASEPTTLVELALAAAPEGTLLTVTESGFDKLPPARRAQAFEMNAGGWAQQLENIARHVHA
jgi:uncharacterized protein YndB with AHSA1/START domain